MKTTLKFFFLLAMSTTIVVFNSCGNGDDEPNKPDEPTDIAVTSISLNKSTLSLIIGVEQTLIATILPENATNKTVTWTSNNEDVAIVDADGKITAIKAGTAIITAQAGEKTATCEVEVDGVLINGVIWATRNVDMPGTFALTPESSGMFYQWNRNVGWSSTDPIKNSNNGTAWDSSYATGTTWYLENDPCPFGWRVPNSVELHSLRDAGHTWVVNWNNTGVNGRLFGTAPYQIFLPAAGSRVGWSGVLTNVGWFGNYWSSTQFDSTSTHARALDINSSIAGLDLAWERRRGLSIRCVAE